MKKVFFVTGAMKRGGAERVISLLANYYVSKGVDVSVLLLLHSDVEYELDKKIHVVDLSEDGKNIKLALPSVAIKLRKYVKANRPDRVVSFMAQNCFICGLAFAGMKMKDFLICSERIDPAMVNRSAFMTKALNLVYSRCRKSIMQTQRAINYFPEAVRKNSIIIPNPIEVKAEAGYDGSQRVVTAGRLTAQKNHAMLIGAFETVHKAHPGSTLSIYGDGELKDKLGALIKEKGLEDCVFLMGNVSNIHEQMKNAAMFVLSSDFEGLSNALLEAMMMGLPVISTDCAGSDEAINNEVDGLLVSVGDMNALASAMERYLSDGEFAARTAAAAKKKASEVYGFDKVISQWINTIEG